MTDRKVRRIVTGHDDQGRSVIVSDTTAQMERPLHELWVTHGPAHVGRPPELAALPTDLEPPEGGTIIRFVRFEPAAGRSREEMDKMYAAVFASINASHTRVDTRRHPGMHKTKSLDYGILLAGRLTLLLDDGDVDLEPFDVVVQRGTNHGWSNPGPEPALMAFILIDATP
jgi:hypothetical protein